jgi:hypothetical protein
VNTKRVVILCVLLGMASLQVRAEDVIAAKVNDEAITEAQLNQGLPKDAFGVMLTNIRKFRLERLVNTIQTRQFLTKNGVHIDDKTVDAEIAIQRKTPPAALCACCSYNTLEQFLEGSYLTLEEYREIIRNNKGVETYLKQLWTQKVADAAAIAKLVKENRPTVERDFAKLSHICFNDIGSGKSRTAEEDAVREAYVNARAAWQRLKKGEDFAVVAKELSNDRVSAKEGGFLGFISRESSPFGAKATAAVFLLNAGEYSEPVGSPWGYHIFRRDSLTDDDVLTVLKETFQSERDEELQTKIGEQSKVEFFGAYKHQP